MNSVSEVNLKGWIVARLPEPEKVERRKVVPLSTERGGGEERTEETVLGGGKINDTLTK